jgi:hypothetical protein
MDKNTFIQLSKSAYQLTLFFPNKEPLRYKIREVANDIMSGFIIKENDYLGDLKAQIDVIDGYFEIAMAQDWTSPAKIKELKDNYLRAGFALEELRSNREIETKPAAEEKRTGFIMVPEAAKTGIIPPLPQSIIEPPAYLKPMVVPEPVLPPVARIEEVGQASAKAREEAGEEEQDIAGEEDNSALTGSQILRQNRILEFLKQKGGAQVWEIQKIFPSVSKRTIRRDFRSMLKQGVIERTGERNTTAYKLKVNLS